MREWRYLAVNKSPQDSGSFCPPLPVGSLQNIRNRKIKKKKSLSLFCTDLHPHMASKQTFWSRQRCSTHTQQHSWHAHAVIIQSEEKHTHYKSNLCYRYVHISIFTSLRHGPAALSLCFQQHLPILEECLWWASLTCIVCAREFRPSAPGLGPHLQSNHRQGCHCD